MLSSSTTESNDTTSFELAILRAESAKRDELFDMMEIKYQQALLEKRVAVNLQLSQAREIQQLKEQIAKLMKNYARAVIRAVH